MEIIALDFLPQFELFNQDGHTFRSMIETLIECPNKEIQNVAWGVYAIYHENFGYDDELAFSKEELVGIANPEE